VIYDEVISEAVCSRCGSVTEYEKLANDDTGRTIAMVRRLIFKEWLMNLPVQPGRRAEDKKHRMPRKM